MSINPNDDNIAKFKRSYQGYLDNLSPDKRQALEELIDLCYPYIASINAKAEPFEEEPVEITMLLVQQLIIKAMKEEDSKAENFKEVLLESIKTIDNISGELQRIRKLIYESITGNKVLEPKSEFQTKLKVE